MSSFRHASVPYFAQWASPEWVRPIVEDGADPCDDPEWTSTGFESADEYRFWARRMCGLACLESVLTYWGLLVPSRASMLRSAVKWGAYRQIGPDEVEGLVYAPFAEWVVCDFGLHARVLGRLPVTDLPALVDDDSFVIASVSPEIRYPDRPNLRTGGHLVLIHGSSSEGLRFHNPSGIPPHQSNACLDLPTFPRFYASRGIHLRRLSTGSPAG